MQKVHIQHFKDTYFYVYVLPVLLTVCIYCMCTMCACGGQRVVEQQ